MYAQIQELPGQPSRALAKQRGMPQLFCLSTEAAEELILIAAIALWNTTYLGDAVAAMRAEGEGVPDELLVHLSPMAWSHINLLGRYQFRSAQQWDLQQRRPLRKNGDEQDEDDDSR